MPASRPTSSKARLRRVIGFTPCAAALAGLALLATGCGSSPATPAVANIGSTTATGTSSTTTTTGGGAQAGGTQPQNPGGSSSGFRLAITGPKSGSLEAFYACMRSHGVPNFPDPNSQGGISVTSANGIDPNSPQFQSAQTACQKLMPKGAAPSPAEQAQAQAQALKYSACMRSHGEPNFPDPQFHAGGGISVKVTAGSGVSPNSPQFQSAQKACQNDRPGLANTASGKAGTTSSGGVTK
jgi:hypothetical protein